MRNRTKFKYHSLRDQGSAIIESCKSSRKIGVNERLKMSGNPPFLYLVTTEWHYAFRYLPKVVEISI